MLQTDLTSDYFNLFGVPVSFEVNIPELTSRYREMQRAVHPDRYANASDAERRISMQMAARVNEGYKVLKDPLSRSRYLLELQGININDADTSLDNVFLMEQMELREQLGELADSNEPETELQTFKKHLSIRINEILVRIADTFNKGDKGQLGQVVELTKKLQFFRKLEEEADELEENLVGY
ncbi:Fe-S protein assembly co-chaperone HscB [Kaarinaea lacus]